MKVLVTRPIEEAILLAKKLRKIGYKPVIEPLLEVKMVDPLDMDDFAQFEAIIISSKNAIKAIKTADKNLKLIIVGKESTKFAQSLGFVNSYYGGNTIAELKNKLTNYSNLLYLTGSDVTDDLSSLKINITRKITYQTTHIQELSANLKNFITDSDPKIALFFSTITANIFKNLIHQNKLNLYCDNIIALTLSAKIAHTLEDINFKKCCITREPKVDSVINLIKEIQNG